MEGKWLGNLAKFFEVDPAQKLPKYKRWLCVLIQLINRSIANIAEPLRVRSKSHTLENLGTNRKLRELHHYYSYIFDFGRPRYCYLTAVAINYPLTSITWLYRGFRLKAHPSCVLFLTHRWPVTGFSPSQVTLFLWERGKETFDSYFIGDINIASTCKDLLGAIIGDETVSLGVRAHPWYGTIFLFLEQIAPSWRHISVRIHAHVRGARRRPRRCCHVTWSGCLIKMLRVARFSCIFFHSDGREKGKE